MKKLWILFILFLVGCSPASISTPTLVPATSTKISTPTLIPTSTPYPPLQTDGPYLLFTNDRKNFTIMDADGSGRKQFQLPNNGYVSYYGDSSLQNSFSPDGKWVAYFTGDALEKPYDLTLHLFDIEDKTTLEIAKLLTPDYPNNLLSVKIDEYVKNFHCETDDCIINIVKFDFIQGIESLDWSPDSKFLAFAAQIDDPSSDVYILDVETKSLRRFSADNNNVRSIDWTPNGKTILFKNSLASADYTPISIHIADATQKTAQTPKSIYGGSFWRDEGWVDENLYFVSRGGEGAPPQKFELINTDTQEINQIWKYTAESFFINSKEKEILLLTYPGGLSDVQPEPEEGVYLVKFDGSYKKIADKAYFIFQSEGPHSSYFVFDARSDLQNATSLFNLGIDGKVIDLDKKIFYSYPPITSPNNNWTIITDENATYLYSSNLNIVNFWDFPYSRTIWRPDSLGAFLLTNGKIYYLSILDGEPIMIEDCPSQDCSFRDYIWMP